MVSGTGSFARAPGEALAGASGGDYRHLPASDPRVPLSNLTLLGRRVDSLRRFLADSLDRHADIGDDKIQAVSSGITSAVHQIILNGAALLAFSHPDPPPAASFPAPVSRSDPGLAAVAESSGRVAPARSVDGGVDLTTAKFQWEEAPAPAPAPEETKDKAEEEEDDGEDYEIVEMDTVELLAEHVHFCDICGKGFKRDANLRMHMRAHGNQFKTLEALSKPDHQAPAAATAPAPRKTRFSCPFLGCNRNRAHKRFRPLKSAVCVKNHFRRSHCPKIYSCTRCNKKSFSVLADLKSHLKHCGDCRWRCSCGTSFSRKDKLFGHMALFEGHMPAVSIGVAAGEEDDVGEKGKGPGEEVEEECEEWKGGGRGGGFQGLINGGFDSKIFEEFMVDELWTVDATALMDF